MGKTAGFFIFAHMEERSTTGRIAWIDNCKAIAIGLVALGHLQTNYMVDEVIFAFVLPVFFFLSGYTFSSTATMPFGRMLRKKSQTLLVPYLGFSLILFAFWFFVRRNFGLSGHAADTSVTDALLQIFYGVNSEFFVTPLWFLTCLFVVEVFFWLLLRLRVKTVIAAVVLGLFVFGLYYWTYMDIKHFPHAFWNMDQACFYLYFFAVGYTVYRCNLVERVLCPKWKSCAVVALSAVVFALAFFVRENVAATWQFLLMQAVMCNAGLLACIALGRLIRENSVLNFVGRNSLAFFALHMMVQAILIGTVVKVFGMDVGSLHGSLGICIMLTLISLFALVPVIFFINRYAAWLVGRRKISQ